MNSDPLEGQMTLFETPAVPEKPKSVRKKSARAITPEAPAKKEAKKAAPRGSSGTRKGRQKSPGNGKEAVKARPTSGQVPEGDVRLTANIREDLHLKLKIAAAHRRTTIGELIEMLVAKHLK
uniref:Uncharacterized protein n=1 Tax=Geobacter metallireducens TaxID=28232 RepID=A0A831UAI4_GEOME